MSATAATVSWVLVARLGLVAFAILLALTPRWRFTREMLATRGPRTNVARMTKRELAASGAQHLGLAVLVFGTGVALAVLAEWLGMGGMETLPGQVMFGVSFVLFLVGIIVAVAGVILLVRAPFRSRHYRPPPLAPPRWPHVG